ncbi:hypothetical protein AB0G15_32960 [Streptosporangium sp. NPDC023825]
MESRARSPIYPGSHFTFYTDLGFRSRVVTEQVGFYPRTFATM